MTETVTDCCTTNYFTTSTSTPTADPLTSPTVFTVTYTFSSTSSSFSLPPGFSTIADFSPPTTTASSTEVTPTYASIDTSKSLVVSTAFPSSYSSALITSTATPSPSSSPDTSSATRQSIIAIVIAAVVVGALLVLAVALVLFQSRRRKRAIAAGDNRAAFWKPRFTPTPEAPGTPATYPSSDAMSMSQNTSEIGIISGRLSPLPPVRQAPRSRLPSITRVGAAKLPSMTTPGGHLTPDIYTASPISSRRSSVKSRASMRRLKISPTGSVSLQTPEQRPSPPPIPALIIPNSIASSSRSPITDPYAKSVRGERRKTGFSHLFKSATSSLISPIDHGTSPAEMSPGRLEAGVLLMVPPTMVSRTPSTQSKWSDG